MQASCRLLKVSEAGYYEWRNRPPSLRALRHTWLLEQITAVHAASRGTYGARRIHAELTLGLGLSVGHNQNRARDVARRHQRPTRDQTAEISTSDTDSRRPGQPDVHP